MTQYLLKLSKNWLQTTRQQELHLLKNVWQALQSQDLFRHIVLSYEAQSYMYGEVYQLIFRYWSSTIPHWKPEKQLFPLQTSVWERNVKAEPFDQFPFLGCNANSENELNLRQSHVWTAFSKMRKGKMIEAETLINQIRRPEWLEKRPKGSTLFWIPRPDQRQ